ncbi:unnamed protein product [Boreogadus saida]
MSRKKLAWANKEVETFVCILGEEDVVYDVYVAAAVIDIRPTTKGTVGSGNATSELSWANRSLPTAPLRSDPFRTLQWKCGITATPSQSHIKSFPQMRVKEEVYNGFLALALPQTPDGQAAGVLVHMWRTGPGPLGNTAQHVWLLLKQGG